MRRIIGIDLGGTSAKFGLFTEDGQILEISDIPSGKEKGSKKLLHEIAEHVKNILSDNNLSQDDLIGVGIGLPGPVLNASIVNGCVNLGWDLTPIVDILQQEGLTCPIFAENDANVAALGESWKGAAEDYDSMVFVTIGTGVGGGVIIKGKLLSGAHGSGGEIGHMPVLQEELPFECGCGGRHCLEQVCSAPNIYRYAGELLAEDKRASSLREFDGEFECKDIFMAAEKGDGLAQKVIDYSADCLGRGLAILASAFDPEVFVIGGGVSNAGDTLLDPVRAAYKKYVFYPLLNTPIIKADLGNDAGMYGAARLALGGEED